jgi:hypothetical protein
MSAAELLREARELILAHVDLNTCLPHERGVISRIDAHLASQPASQPDSVAVPVSLMQSWHDFWANYSSLNEDCQDDLNEKRHQVLDEMLRAAKEPK